MGCSGVQYRCIFLLVLCILTRPAGSSKYCTTRKNIQRYCTTKHPIRYIYNMYKMHSTQIPKKDILRMQNKIQVEIENFSTIFQSCHFLP